MENRGLGFVVVFTALAVSCALPAASQNSQSQPSDWTVPRTADGQPDLQGVWDFRTITPLERPSELAGKEVLTAEEAAAFTEERLSERNKDLRAEDGIGAQQDVANAYNQFWWDYGNQLTEDRRTSLIVDPPDGRIPLKPAVRREREERAATRTETRGTRITSGPEDRGLAERCILGFNSGPPMNPSAYNNNVQLVQTPDHVMILNEMVHNARVVPLDGRPHLPGSLRQWVGDARGHWEGDTLVVETTNFHPEAGFRGSSKDRRLVERFTRSDANTLLYEYTLTDPTTWTRPWTVVVPMTKSEGPMFEYACHEGNYGMTNLLAGSRAEERALASGATDSK